MTLSLDNAELANGFQTDITLPTGLSIAETAGKLDVYFGENAAADSHVISAAKVDGVNKYRIVVYSSQNETFKNGDNLLNISIVSSRSINGGEITIDNTTISLADDMDCNSANLKIPVAVYLYGDSNDNGIVAIDDVVTDVQYILEKDPTPFNFKNADVNRDNAINIIDVSNTVSIILTDSPSNFGRRAPGIGLNSILHGIAADDVTLTASHKTMTISLGDVDDITALQGDIELPEDVSIAGITVSAAQRGDHSVAFSPVGDGHMRFVIYSLSLSRMNSNEPMIDIELECSRSFVDRTIGVSDILASDVHSNLVRFDSLRVNISNGSTTGIEEHLSENGTLGDVYTLQGICMKRDATQSDLDNLAPGIYIIRQGDKVEKIMKL